MTVFSPLRPGVTNRLIFGVVLVYNAFAIRGLPGPRPGHPTPGPRPPLWGHVSKPAGAEPVAVEHHVTTNQRVPYALDRYRRPIPAWEARPGDILVAQISEADPLGASRRLVRMRREIPWAPLVLVASSGTSQHLAAVGAVAGEVGARAVATTLDADWPELLHRLSDCEALGKDFARWIALQRPDLRRITIKRMEALVVAGLAGEHVHDVAAACDITERGLEDTFRRARLACPSKYVQFGRLMPGLNLLCRKPGTRLIDAAEASQYSTASAFIRVLTGVLGIHANEARGRVGFEWVAHHLQLHHCDRNIE